MSDEPEAAKPLPEATPRRWFQFNLKTMMIAVTLVCIFCVGGMDLFNTAYISIVPTALAIAIWNGRGWIRPFAVCAIVPHVPIAWDFIVPGYYDDGVLVILFAGLLAGITGAALHCYLQKANGFVPVPNVPYLRDWFSNDLGDNTNE